MKKIILDGSSILHFNDDEQKKLSKLLKIYFPWLGTEEEIEGSEVISELINLYNAIGEVE